MSQIVKATQQLEQLGQRIWLDNITRDLLDSGTLSSYIRKYSVTGLTSNPTIFENAISAGSDVYDAPIREKTAAGKKGEELFFELALEDLARAADLFWPIFDATDGVDGWVSLEVSPLLACDMEGTVKAALHLYRRGQRANLFIKIPGTHAGLAAIEQAIFLGIPINVTLLFSCEQYQAAADAYMSGIERRLAADLDPNVASVASIFVSRWDVAINDKVTKALRNRLGCVIASRVHQGYRERLASQRWQRLAEAGAKPQRLLWASTGSKDPSVSDVLYVEALAVPETINTMPEKTLLAFAEHGNVSNCIHFNEEECASQTTALAEFERQGINVNELAATLQAEGTAAFAKSWQTLLATIDRKSKTTVTAAMA